MAYEYFTNLDIEHINVDEINQEFKISEFCRGIEFSKTLNYDDAINLDFLFESISNLELKDVVISLYSGLTELSLSKINGLTLSFELINFLDFFKKETLKDSISSNPNFLFSKSLTQIPSLASEYQIDLAISQLLKDIVTSMYSGLTSLSFAKTNSLKSSFSLDNYIQFDKDIQSSDINNLIISLLFSKSKTLKTKNILIQNLLFTKSEIFKPDIFTNQYIDFFKTLNLKDSVSIVSGVVTSLSFSKINSFTPDITLIHKLLFDKSNSFAFNLIQDYNFELNISQSLEDTITSVFAGLTSLLFSTALGLKPIFSLVLPRDRLANKVVKELFINIKQIPISISVKQIPISISAYSG